MNQKRSKTKRRAMPVANGLIGRLLFLLAFLVSLESRLWATENETIQHDSVIEDTATGIGTELPELLEEVINERNTIFSVGKLYHLVTNATDQELEFIWKEYPKDVYEIGTVGRGRARPETFLELLAERNPELAVHFAESEKVPSRRALYLDGALAGWVRVDHSSALAYFQSIKSGQVKNELSDRFLKAVARQDHQLAFKLATEVFGRDLVRRTVTAVFGEWLQVNPAEVAAFLEANPEYIEITHVYNSLAANWALIDYAGLKAWAEGPLNHLARRAADAVMDSISSQVDPETRMAEIKRMPYGDRREKAIGKLAKGIMWSGFEVAKQWLLSIEDRNDKTTATRVLAYVWIEHDPEGFAEALEEYPADPFKEMLMRRLGQVWGERDPKRAVEWAKRIPIGSRNDRVIEDVFKVVLKADLEYAMRLLQELPEGRRKQFVFQIAVKHLAGLDSERTIDFVLEQPAGRLRESLMRSLLAELTNQDPERLYSFLDGFPPSKESNSLRRGAAWLLAQRDFNGALAWARGTKNESARRQALIGLLGDWVRQNPENAKDFARSLKVYKDRSQAVQTIAIALIQVSVDDSIEWLEEVDDSIDRSKVILAAVEYLAIANPVKTGAYVEKLEGDEIKQTALYLLIDEWANKAPQTAIEWFLERPTNTSTRRLGLEGCFRIWANKDEMAFEAWVESQNRGAAKDLAISVMVRSKSDCPGVKAIYWAGQITESEQKLNTLRYSLLNWLRCDRNAAMEWIMNSDLPEEFLEELKQMEKLPRFDEKKSPA